MMIKKFKICTRCKKEKLISDFEIGKTYISKKNGELKNYQKSECRDCGKKRLIMLNSKKRNRRVYNDRGDISWRGVYHNIKKKCKYYERNIEFNISLKEFNKWISNQVNQCTYCGSTPERVQKIILNFFKVGPIANSKRLQIDRKNNKIGYSIDNICFACAICNNHKADFFSHEEFLKIAEEFIKPNLKKLEIA